MSHALNGAIEKHPELSGQKRGGELIDSQYHFLPEYIRGVVRTWRRHVNHNACSGQIREQQGGSAHARSPCQQQTCGSSMPPPSRKNSNRRLNQFGRRRAWLVRTKAGAFEVKSTPNHDNLHYELEIPVFWHEVFVDMPTT